MEIICLGSNSRGNGYVLRNNQESLILECGCPLKSALKAISYQIQNCVGCLVTHEHSDHAKFIQEYSKIFDIYTSKGTAVEIYNNTSEMFANQIIAISPFKEFKLGGFNIRPFTVEHDAAEPFGYIIEHSDFGRLAFITDTSYCRWKLKNVNIWLIEANYDEINPEHPEFVKRRIERNHMQINTTIETIKLNGTEDIKQIILIHLNQNQDKDGFKSRVQNQIGKQTFIADRDFRLNLGNPIAEPIETEKTHWVSEKTKIA